MHDLVGEMALEIARQQLILDPGKPIQLWRHEDIYHFLMNYKGTETVRYISLDMCKIKRTTLTASAFQKMYDLRFLKFYKSDRRKPSNVYIFEDLDNLSEELRFFFWEEYPLPSVPFCAKNLIQLEMPNSDVRQLWDGDQHLPNLRLINLTGSKQFIELPDLSQAPNIETILLGKCENLAQIHSSSVLGKLFQIWIQGCKELRHVNIGGNIIGRNPGLVAVYNFLNLNDFSFKKVTVKLLVSDDSNIFSSFQIKVVLLPFTEISECMGNIESAKLKLLTRSFASLLPFVSRLRWLDSPTEFGNFKKHFDYPSHYEEKTDSGQWEAFNEPIGLAIKTSGLLARLISESATRERANKEEPSGVLAPLEFEEELMMEVECCSSNCNRLTRVPNSITCWSL